MFGLVSGIINGNSLLITALGTFDYIKNFLVVFIYAAFFRDDDEFRKLFRLLLVLAVLLGTVALIQFLWAMGSVYILGKDITDKSIYIFVNMPVDLDIVWRYGIYRTSSLTYHAYIIGLFNLLIFTIYFYTEKRIAFKIYVPLLSGIIAGVSRMAFAGLIYVTLLQIIKGKKWTILLLLIFTAFLAFSKIDYGKKLGQETFDIRAQTRHTALEIWKDHPYWGVGTGMFGGIVASKYNSYIYSEYNMSNLAYIHKAGGIEQFWFQILAEMGIVGTLLFLNILVLLFMTLFNLREQEISQDMKNLFSALMVFIPCIFIYSIGSGINIAPVLFTYCAFVGIGLGRLNNQSDK